MCNEDKQGFSFHGKKKDLHKGTMTNKSRTCGNTQDTCSVKVEVITFNSDG